MNSSSRGAPPRRIASPTAHPFPYFAVSVVQDGGVMAEVHPPGAERVHPV